MTDVVVTLPPGGEHVVNWLARCPNLTSDLRSTGVQGRYRLGQAGPLTQRRTLEQLTLTHLVTLKWSPPVVTLRQLWPDRAAGHVVVWPFVTWPVCPVKGTGGDRHVCGRPATFAVPVITAGRVTGWDNRCDLCVRDDRALPYVKGVLR